MSNIYDYENKIASLVQSPTDSFLYLWENLVDNKFYIGVHKGTINDGYITSSKLFLEEYNKNPQNFKRTILNFGKYENLLKLETKLLNKVNAKMNDFYYNMHNGDGNFFVKKHSDATRKKMSMVKNGLIKSHNSKTKEERKQEFSEKCRKRRLGAKETEETKNKHRLLYNENKHILQAKKVCEHCGFETTIGNYARHHGDNCGKNKTKEQLEVYKNAFLKGSKKALHDTKYTCEFCGFITNIGNHKKHHGMKCKKAPKNE